MLRPTLLLAALVAAALPALAETRRDARLGPETNLPLPRFVSLNVAQANIRRGPGLSHRIDWVFLRRDTPLEVIEEHGHWRKVRDADNADGWVHHSLLRGRRTAVVVAAPDATLHAEPSLGAAPVARAETGVIARVLSCIELWCRLEAEGRRGWAQKADIWGVGRDEVF